MKKLIRIGMKKQVRRLSTLYKFEPIDAWLTPLMISVITLGGIQLMYSLLVGPFIAIRYPGISDTIWKYGAIITVGMFILLYGLFLIFYLNQQKLSRTLQKDMLVQVLNAIDAFTPSGEHENVEGYEMELCGWLRDLFPDVEIRCQDDSQKPCVVVENIGIEVKFPADNQALESLATLCLKHAATYRSLIIVLLDPQYARSYYHDIENGIKQYFPNVKIVQK